MEVPRHTQDLVAVRWPAGMGATWHVEISVGRCDWEREHLHDVVQLLHILSSCSFFFSLLICLITFCFFLLLALFFLLLFFSLLSF